MKYFLVLLILSTISLYAQKNSAYKEGYVVLVNGDTIAGKVMDRDDSAYGGLLTKVRFRSDKGRRKKYKPKHLLGYKRGEDSFESLWITTETKNFKQRYLSRDGLGEEEFVKLIYRGSLDLYHWEYSEQDNNYIDFVPLIRKNGADEMVRVTQGILGLKRKRLAEYFADCPKLVNDIKSKTINSAEELISFYELHCKP